MSWQVGHSVSLQALFGTAPLRWTSHRAALGAPRGLSRVCFGSVFYMPESVSVDSALLRVALLETDLRPSPWPCSLIFLHFSHLCLLEVECVSEACLYWR